MRIAIVDDNHTDRIFLREGLERILLKRNIENSYLEENTFLPAYVNLFYRFNRKRSLIWFLWIYTWKN